MRKGLLIILFLMLASIAFGEVTAEIIGYSLDDNGNIVVKTQYKVDGVEVKSKYPKLGGKYYFVSRYNSLNFVDMTDEEMKNRILEDLNQHATYLVQHEFLVKTNKKIHDEKLRTVVGEKVLKVTAEFLIDTNSDGKPDKKWMVKTDGTKVEKAIIIP